MVQLQTARTRARIMSRSSFMVTIFPLNILPSFRNFLFLSLSPIRPIRPIRPHLSPPPHIQAMPVLGFRLTRFVLPTSSRLSPHPHLRASIRPRPHLSPPKRPNAQATPQLLSPHNPTTPVPACLRPQSFLACPCVFQVQETSKSKVPVPVAVPTSTSRRQCVCATSAAVSPHPSIKRHQAMPVPASCILYPNS